MIEIYSFSSSQYAHQIARYQSELHVVHQQIAHVDTPQQNKII